MAENGLKLIFIFPTQIVVMKQLNSELHFWLSNLRKNIKEQIFREIIIKMHSFTTKQEKEYAKAYFGALAEYNNQIHAKAKGDDIMNEYMKEFYKEEMEASYSQGHTHSEDESILKLLRKNKTINEIADLLEFTVERVTAVAKANGYSVN